jgi:NDP-sugar pyrophosphorylase family protein
MDAVIPAAGRGSRLVELTDDRPTGLVDVAGRPLLAHVFGTAVDAGADELVVIVGYEAGQIADRFGDAFEGVPITYVHQRERLGLRHAVLQAEPHAESARKADAKHTHASVKKAGEVIGYEPSRTITEGVGEFIEWYEPLVRES